MKTSHSLIRISCLLALAAALVASGCSKKKETPPMPAAAPTPPAAPATPSTPASSALTDATKSAADALKDAKKNAEATAAAAAAEAKKKAESAAAIAAAEAKKKAEAAAAAAAAATTPAPSPAPSVTPPVVSGTGQADLAGAASLAADQSASTLDALKSQATQLLTQYSGELATLKTNAVALKDIIDKNANLLPAGVAAKYQELNSLLPQLSGLVDTLKNYQTADLTTLVPKLKTDFAKAQALYGEIKGLLPAM